MVGGIRDLFSGLISAGVLADTSLVACSALEVRSAEDHFGVVLPRAYKEFLLIAGKSAGKLFWGTDIFFPRVLELQDEARELFAELGLTDSLPPNAKVFCMHQGYQVNYFLPGSDNPAIYQFVEGEREVAMPWDTFTDFIAESIGVHSAQWASLD